MTIPSGPEGPDTAPGTDWLTGLGSRAAFGRQVIQADRDRDRFVIALIEIDDFGEVNHRLDHESGDELLRELGRRLGAHTSVTTFAARLGGARFAVLSQQPPSVGLRQWIAPLVASARDAIADWTFELIDYTGDCPVEPRLRAGLASGRSSEVWTDAATALELARTDPLGEPVVVHDRRDPRVIALSRRHELSDCVARALIDETLDVVTEGIEAVRGQEPTWQWLELAVVDPSFRVAEGVGGGQPSILDRSTLPAGIQRRLDHWLIDQAGRMLSQTDSQLRVTVPVTGESVADRALARRILALFEGGRIPPSRLLFEVSEAVLMDDPSPGCELARRLDRLGSGLMVGRCTGGWPAWRVLQDLPVRYLKPDRELLNRAAAAEPAPGRILGAMVDNAVSTDRQLVAPPTSVSDGRLAELGFNFRQRPAERVPVSRPVR